MSNTPKVRTPTFGFLASANLTQSNTFVVFDGDDSSSILQNKDDPVEVPMGTILELRETIRAQQSSIETLIYKHEAVIVQSLKNEGDTSNHIDFDLSIDWSNYVDGLVLDSLHSSLEEGDLIRFSITLKTTDNTNSNEVTLFYYCKSVSIVGS